MRPDALFLAHAAALGLPAALRDLELLVEATAREGTDEDGHHRLRRVRVSRLLPGHCLLYTSDAADE